MVQARGCDLDYTRNDTVKESNPLLRIIIVVAATALMILHFFAVYVIPGLVPDGWGFLRRNWGFHFYLFYPNWMAALAYCVAAIAVVPQLNRLVYRTWFNWVPSVPTDLARKPQNLLFFVAVVLSWIVFWAFRQKYGFLGDGYVRVGDVENGIIGSEGWGAVALQIGLYRLFKLWGKDAVFSVQVFSTIWGGIYVWLTCLWANHVGNSWAEKGVAAGCLILIGPIQLFFGYIEAYAPLPVFLIGFILSTSFHLSGKGSVWWPTLWVVAGVTMHSLMAACLPALVYLWCSHLADKYPRFGNALPWMGIIVVVCSAGLVYEPITSRGHLLPLIPSKDSTFAILSAVHLWEWINAQMLGAPMFWPVLLFICAVMVRRCVAPDKTLVFLFITSATMLFASFVLNYKLGSKDWDLQCIVAVPLMSMAAYGLVNTLRPYFPNTSTQHVWIVTIVFSALNVIPWVLINSSDKSIERLSQILEDDPAESYKRFPPDLTTGNFYAEAGLNDEALASYIRGHAKAPLDERMPYNIGALYYHKREFDMAIEYFSRAVANSPTYRLPQKGLTQLYRVKGDYKRAAHHMSKYLEFGGKDKDMLALLKAWVDTLNSLGAENDQALKLMQQAVEILPEDADFKVGLGKTYLKQGLDKEAAACFLQANELLPGNVDIHLNLALAYMRLGQFNKAIRACRATLSLDPNNRQASSLLRALYSHRPAEKLDE